MIYVKTFISETEEDIVPMNQKDPFNVMLPYKDMKLCSLHDIFADCKEISEEEFLNVTKIKENLDPSLTPKAQVDFDVSFNISYLFIPYTKYIYTTIALSFSNGELVKEIFDRGLFVIKRYMEYFSNYVVTMINEAYKMKNEIKLVSNPYNYAAISIGDWSDCGFLDAFPEYKCDDYISPTTYSNVVAQQNIIIELIKKIKIGFSSLKSNAKVDHNNLLLELKKGYVDYLNLTSNPYDRDDEKKYDSYYVLYKLLNIDSLNNEYQNLLKNYEDLVKTVVDQKNITLADMLNTIQISSIALTIVGWVLVILQHDLPSKTPIYLLAILFCTFVSVTIAIIIKKIIGKNNTGVV